MRSGLKPIASGMNIDPAGLQDTQSPAQLAATAAITTPGGLCLS